MALLQDAFKCKFSDDGACEYVRGYVACTGEIEETPNCPLWYR